MSIHTDEPRGHWNAETRGRTETRALLMALSRDREWYFVLPIFRTALLGVVTLGLSPALMLRNRSDRWRRLEWTQREALANWIAAYCDADIGGRLARWAVHHARPSRVEMLSSALWSAIGIALATTGYFIARNGVSISGWTWPEPGKVFVCLAIVQTLICIDLTWRLTQRVQFAKASNGWLAMLNGWMIANDKRAIVAGGSAVRWKVVAGLMALATTFALVAFPLWIVLVPIVILVWNRDMVASRAVRLQFIERLLEWMDDSGMPIEYDVEALEPEEVAAMIA